MQARLRLLAAVICLVVAAGSTQAQHTDAYERLLQEHGLAPTRESLEEYLHSLHPNEQTEQRISALVRQLGDDDFFRREAATRELLRIPAIPPEVLRNAAAGRDAEVRWRAQRVLDVGSRRSSEVLHAVLRTIDAKEVSGLVEPLLAALPFCTEEYLAHALHRALEATALPTDLPALRQALQTGNEPARLAAVAALAAVLGDDVGDDVRQLLDDPQSRVRLAAARALANVGDRAALPVLGELLGDERLEVRTEASHVLRNLTGERIGFVPYDDLEPRTAQSRRWQQWIEANAATAPLHFPLRDHDVLLGRTLYCNYGAGKIIERDAAGKVVWKTDLAGAWAVHGLPNGHRLVASHTGKIVVEYDAGGREVWRKANLPGMPYGVRRLSNGNTLVPCSDSKKVLELDHQKKIVWEVELDGRPMDARRLENGNTLVSLFSNHRVVEVGRGGKVVWQVTGMNMPISASRLANGNTLVCQYSGDKVVEVDRNGKVVRTIDDVNNPLDAQRLPNGHTLVADKRGLREFDTAGKVVWSHDESRTGRVSRF